MSKKNHALEMQLEYLNSPFTMGKRSRMMNKKGQSGGLMTTLIFSIGFFVVGLIIVFVLIDTLLGANLLTAGGASDLAVRNVTGNFSTGVQNDLAPKIRTAVLVGGIVFVISILAVLVLIYRRMQGASGAGASPI